MSRSRKHTPIVGCARVRSDADFKRFSAKRMRAATRHALEVGADVMPTEGEVSNTDVWAASAKDGKMWVGQGMSSGSLGKATVPGDWEKYLRK